jgi:hypothetical protein
MTVANIARIARLDVPVPAPVASGTGAVEIRDLPVPDRAGPPRARSVHSEAPPNDPTQVSTPGRQALHNHQCELARLEADLERAARPVARLQRC